MAPSRVSGMKMRNLLLGVILGLLAVVHSTPVNTVTQNSEAEDDFFREAMTDGFLIEHSLPTLLTTESLPKKQTDDSSSLSSTTQIPPESGVTASPVANETQTEESNLAEGSGDQIRVEHYTTTTQSVTHIQSATSTVLPTDTDSDSSTTQIIQSGFTSLFIEGSGDWTTSMASTTPSISHVQSSTVTLTEMETPGDSSTTQIPQSDFTSSFMLNETQSTESTWAPEGSTSTLLPIHEFILDSSNTKILQSSFEDGSGETTMATETTMAMTTTSSQKEAHNGSQDINPGMLRNEDKASGGPGNAAHGTPGWIIIVGFIVGVAALVMLCVAIATRDKWNGPSQASQLETNANSTNQQRELEMETFLHKDNPRENGKAADYTVIPLDDLSENYSSH